MAVLEARKLKKMDITGASDPYVKIKLFDSKVSNGFIFSTSQSYIYTRGHGKLCLFLYNYDEIDENV